MKQTNRKVISLFLIWIITLLQIVGLVSCGKKTSDPVVPASTSSNAGEENPSSTESNSNHTNNLGNESSNDNGKYVVRFITDDGVPIMVNESEKGEALRPPTPPRRIGYVFRGWVGDYTNITQNTDIIAAYTDVSDIANAICADTVYSSCGAEFNVLIGIYGEVNFCGLDMEISYDGGLLELVEVTDEDNSIIHNSSTSGVVYLNYVSTDNTTGEVTFMNMKFKSKATQKAETNFHIKVNSMYVLDSNEKITPSTYQVIQNKIIIDTEEANNGH